MRVVLVRPQEPGNIGSAARVMKNFGLSDLILVAPQRSLGKEAFHLATHAKDVLERARIVPTTREAIAECSVVLGTSARERRSQAHDLYTPRDAASSFSRDGLALMFGPEASGLANDDLDLCHAFIKIPTGPFSSLNLAQAVNLIAYEFFVTQVEAGRSKAPPDPANRAMLERLQRDFLETAHHIGYTNAEKHAQTDHMYRRIFDRARLSVREVTALHGLWRQVRWAAEHGPSLPGSAHSEPADPERANSQPADTEHAADEPVERQGKR